MPVLSLLPEEAPAHLVPAITVLPWTSTQSSPSIGPSGLPGAASWTLSRWQTFCSPSLPHGRAQQSGLPPVCLCWAPFYPFLCSRWRMAAVPWHTQGCWRHLHMALCGRRGRAGVQDWALPGSQGTRAGMLRYSYQGCAPPCHHQRGLKGSLVTSYSRGSCLVPRAQRALPSSPHFPGDQFSRSPFCLESSQVFFLLQSCSSCPEAAGSWIARSTEGSTWSTTGKPSSAIIPFPLLTSGPCLGLQGLKTRLVCDSHGRAVPNLCFLHRGEPTSPLGSPSATWSSIAVCPISSARDSNIFGKGCHPSEHTDWLGSAA